MFVFLLTFVSIIALWRLLALLDEHDPFQPNFFLIFSRLLLKYLPGYAASLPRSSTGTFTFEPIKLEGTFTIDEQDLKNFNAACHGGMSNPLFLVAKTTPLVIQLLADRRCPIKPIGAVNTRNIIHVTAPTSGDLRTTAMTYSATFGALPGQRRKRGLEFAITIDILATGTPLVHQELWFLQFLPASYEPRYNGNILDASPTSGELVSTLQMSSKDPKAWARCCKDYNPIHISKLAAKLFGFRSVIAHGNHVAALTIEQLGIKDISTIELQFLRPMLLPRLFDVLKSGQNYVLTSKSGKEHMRMAVKLNE